MNNKNFTDYLFNKMEQDKAGMSFYAQTEKGDLECIRPNEKFNLSIITTNDYLAWSIKGYCFEPKHRKAMLAFIDSYNDMADRKYKLHILFGERKIMVSDIIACINNESVEKSIDDAIDFFITDNEVAQVLNKILRDAKARADMVKKRVDELKTRAFDYENQGEHEKAMRCYHEICQKFYGYGHMELIALHYGHGKETPWGKLPVNKEYQLECQMLAVRRNKSDKFAPMVAYNIAKRIGKDDLCNEIIAIGQECGTWNAIALRRKSDVDPSAELERISDCYRKGVGCARNEEYAKYYDRLLAGERQEVFKDMLLAGFEPVFELMNPYVYYEISSLKDLDGLSDELRDRFLYGDKTKEFNLPEWFVPMVNALPEVESEIVLKQAQSKLQNSIDAFLQKVESGEFEIIENWDSERGVLLEDGENLRYMYLPDFKDLKSSHAAEQLKKMIEDFRKNS